MAMSVQKMATATGRIRLLPMCEVMVLSVKSDVYLLSCHRAPRLSSFLSEDNDLLVKTSVKPPRLQLGMCGIVP